MYAVQTEIAAPDAPDALAGEVVNVKIRNIAKSGAEVKMYHVLNRALAKRGYKVWMNMRLSEVLERAPSELDDVERDVFRKMHFDFVLTKGFSPQFVAEFDGPHHQQDSTSDRLDAVKNKFCKDAGLPMLRISSQELEVHEGVSVLSWILERWIAWQKEEPVILQEIEEELEARGPDDPVIREMMESGFLDPEFDPTFIFDLRHPYPAILTVVHRLHRLGIITGYPGSGRTLDRARAEGRSKDLAECFAWQSHWGVAEDEWQVTGYIAQVTPWQAEAKSRSWPNPDALYTTVQQVRIRWALPIGWGARDVLSGAPKNGNTVEHLEWLCSVANL